MKRKSEPEAGSSKPQAALTGAEAKKKKKPKKRARVAEGATAQKPEPSGEKPAGWRHTEASLHEVTKEQETGLGKALAAVPGRKGTDSQGDGLWVCLAAHSTTHVTPNSAH